MPELVPAVVAAGPAGAGPGERGVSLRLGLTRPFDWPSMLAFLAARAIPGVESVEGGEYRRVVEVDGARGAVALRLAPDGAHLVAEIGLSRVAELPAAVARLRRLLDLDADAAAIDARLAADPLLAPLVAARPGLRVPGAWDPFELAVRAILGQQISVAAARTLAGRIAARFGERLPGGEERGCRLLFPGPERLAGVRLDAIGLTGARAAALAGLARAASEDPSLLAPGPDLASTVERLVALPGVGRWTANVIAMRAFREPDAFPDGDLGLRRALERRGAALRGGALVRRAERWRPWRAYAVQHLWTAGADGLPAAPPGRTRRRGTAPSGARLR